MITKNGTQLFPFLESEIARILFERILFPNFRQDYISITRKMKFISSYRVFRVENSVEIGLVVGKINDLLLIQPAESEKRKEKQFAHAHTLVSQEFALLNESAARLHAVLPNCISSSANTIFLTCPV